MKKVCPNCKGKGRRPAWLGETVYLGEIACMTCYETGYIEVPDDSYEEDNGTADADNKEEHS